MGSVVDSLTNEPLMGATVHINNQAVATDEKGNFIFNKITYHQFTISVTSVGYANFNESFVSTEKQKNIIIKMKSIALNLQALEVKSIRANTKAPFTKTNIGKEAIATLNIAQDLPFILNQTPSVVVNADAGNGVGYTGITIRGTDATRINVTLNGIPYNDAESQRSYFVNIPDMASSLNSIQIQRGVGTSSNGTGAFGASIHLSTNELIEHPYAELNNSFGSFNTFKHTLKSGSGLINKHFTVDARVSQITSDGYIDRAFSKLQSFAFSTAYYTTKASVRLNVFNGKEKTYQAWNGVPENLLQSNRTFNVSGTDKTDSPYDNETDNYQQTHYQLLYNQSFIHKWNFNTALFFTKGAGYYENYRGNQTLANYGLGNIFSVSTSDLINQKWLDNNFYGQIFSFQKKTKSTTFTIGGGWSMYKGKHFGEIIWAKVGINNRFKYYNNDATKSDANLYVKYEKQLNPNLQLYTDIQYRSIQHKMNGFDNNPTLFIQRKFDFINPKIGLTYTKNNWQSFVSYAIAGKEPNRDDVEAGQALQPKAEILYDVELGTEKKTNKYQFGATFYYMNYKDQLVLTGKINDVGSYTRTNVNNSYRIGLELQGGYVISNWLNVNTNFTLSKNTIKQFTEFIDDYDNGGQLALPHNNTAITLSPSAIGNGFVNFIPTKNIEISLINKYVSNQFLDNTQNNLRMLKSFYTADLRVVYTFKNKLFKDCKMIMQAMNIFEKQYEPNGYTFSYMYGGKLNTENFYFPMALRNYMVAINFKL